jgi:glycosyltransferase involved in cell wall biosynthesis
MTVAGSGVAKAKDVVWFPASPLEGWASMDRYWRELSVLAGQHSSDELHFHCAYPHSPPEVSARSVSKRKRFFEKFFIYPWRARFQSGQLAHILDHSYAHLLPCIPSKMRKVVTVFDLVPLEDPGNLKPSQVARFRRVVNHLRSADHLISISEETKRKLGTLLGIPADRVTVAVPGMDFDLFQKPVFKDQRIMKKLAQLPPVIFSVGSAAPRKNLASVPAIFREMKGMFDLKQCCFVRAGEYVSDALKRDIVEVTGEQGFVELGPIFGDDLIAAFQSARVLIFPSTLEGLTFVIPEAMAAGCPVVTNTSTANPEAGGDAALYYQEGDAVMAARQLSSLVMDDAVHVECRVRGIERARQMTWAHHFETVMRVYREQLKLV